MKIILDNIIFSLQKSGGISSVWFELLSRILNSKNEVQCLNYTNNNIFSQSIQYKMKQILSSKLLKFPERYINPRIRKNLFSTHPTTEHAQTHMLSILRLYMISHMNIIIMG